MNACFWVNKHVAQKRKENVIGMEKTFHHKMIIYHHFIQGIFLTL